MATAINITDGYEEPEWNSAPQFKMPGWFEPVMVASILIGSMILTRKHGFKIFDRRRAQYGTLDQDPDSDSARSSDDLLTRDYMVANEPSDNDSAYSGISTMKNPPKKRDCCCAVIYTPNTSRFANHYHSRLLQKFPFLIEMFYWILTYAFYRCTKILSEAIFSGRGIWDVAQDHALAILEFEQFSWLSFLWPVKEVSV